MKSLIRFRIAWLALLLSAALFTACKKGTDPAPADLATRAAGQYTYSELTYDGKTLPASETNLKGNINVTRTTGTTVALALDIRLKSTNEEFMVVTADGVEVAEAGSGDISFRYEGEQVATLKGSKLTINGEDESNVPFRISATK
jgi:uncharacterized glyoxalase superfamily protein PhnB